MTNDFNYNIIINPVFSEIDFRWHRKALLSWKQLCRIMSFNF